MAATPDTNIGRLSPPSTNPFVSRASRNYSEQHATLSPPGASEPSPTSGKITPQSPTRDSNSGNDQSTEPMSETGSLSGSTLSLELSPLSLPIYEYVVTMDCEESGRITLDLLRWNEQYLYSGAQLELANLVQLGKQQVWKLTLRILEPNSGTDIATRTVLSSMSFEEVSISLTCCYGSIGIQSMWKSKEPAFHYPQPSSG